MVFRWISLVVAAPLDVDLVIVLTTFLLWPSPYWMIILASNLASLIKLPVYLKVFIRILVMFWFTPSVLPQYIAIEFPHELDICRVYKWCVAKGGNCEVERESDVKLMHHSYRRLRLLLQLRVLKFVLQTCDKSCYMQYSFHTHTHTHTHTHPHTCTHTRTHTHIHKCTHTHKLTHTHAHTPAHTHAHTRTHTHTPTHTHNYDIYVLNMAQKFLFYNGPLLQQLARFSASLSSGTWLHFYLIYFNCWIFI